MPLVPVDGEADPRDVALALAAWAWCAWRVSRHAPLLRAVPAQSSSS